MLYNGCKTCPLNPVFCHGVEEGFAVDGCMAFDHKKCTECGWTCLCNLKLFAERHQEVGNFKCQLQRDLLPVDFQLPRYIPTLYHGFDQARPLDLDWVAIPLHILFRSHTDGSMVPIARTARELRELLGVRLNTKIILTGVGPDQGIENFWGNHQKDNLLTLLRQLGIHLFTVPNYSFFTNAPPPHNRYNRSRILRIAERAADAGIISVLHLNAIFEEEWKDWETLLIQHSEITVVCLEFQTGYKGRIVGDRAFNRLVKLLRTVGRPIHPIVIGGARYAGELGKHSIPSTIIDAQPFMQTFQRKICLSRPDGSIEWMFKRSKVGELLDARFRENFAEYSRYIGERLSGQQSSRQAEFPFPHVNEHKLNPPCKQNVPETLPLFSPPQTPHQQILDPIPQSRFGHPNGKPAESRIAIVAKPILPKIELATSRPNSRHKNNFRKPQPNGFEPANTTDATGGH